ncbi:MAG TPA: T9SS type A sorting domain-containing protein [Hanamia sp.]|nr:T9SS type A sorting domain-containing protein [Hanamia sp.]
MRTYFFAVLAVACFTFSAAVSKANPFGPLRTQATPISGITTFDNLYSGTPVDLTGIKVAGGAGLTALNVAGYDAKLFTSSSVAENGMSIETINGQSALLHAYVLNPLTNIGSLQISSNDKSYFDLKAVDITIDSFSTGTAQFVRLIGYRNGSIASGAISIKTVTASRSGGLLVHFDVSALPGFQGVNAFSIQTDGSYFFKDGIGVDNINAVNFRTVLPVNLISYDALLLKNRTVSLKWSTASEINNDYYLINRSSNGNDFSPLAKVNGDPASADLIKYEFIDLSPLDGNNFYRLSQVDIDGNQKILSVKKVTVKPSGSMSLYPNPVVGNSVNLDYGKIVSSNVTYKLVDASGKVVSSGKIHQQIQELNLPVLGAGIYSIQLSDGKSIRLEKK